jgi:DnaJ domain
VEFVLLGALALVVVIGLVWLFVTSDPRMLAKVLRYVGAGLLLAAAIGLAFIDRVGVAMLLGSMAWGVFTGGRVWPGGWPYYHFPPGGRGKPSGGQSTRVATDWIEVELDHGTGAMTGRVLKGAHAGARLGALTQSQLIALHREASGDEETMRLLEAYLDRAFADWRAAGQGQPPPASSTMSRAEAWRVLGLQPGASEEEVRAAHRKLMLQNHPDRGGSDYLASKINEAKDVLLGG